MVPSANHRASSAKPQRLWRRKRVVRIQKNRRMRILLADARWSGEASQREETKKDGRLEGRTISLGSSTRLDDSRGKLRAEKTEEALRVSFAQEKQFGGPFREPVRKR